MRRGEPIAKRAAEKRSRGRVRVFVTGRAPSHLIFAFSCQNGWTSTRLCSIECQRVKKDNANKVARANLGLCNERKPRVVIPRQRGQPERELLKERALRDPVSDHTEGGLLFSVCRCPGEEKFPLHCLFSLPPQLYRLSPKDYVAFGEGLPVCCCHLPITREQAHVKVKQGRLSCIRMDQRRQGS